MLTIVFPKTKNYFTKLANRLMQEKEKRKRKRDRKIIKRECGILNNKNKKAFWGIM
jgi:hypothetical protein